MPKLTSYEELRSKTYVFLDDREISEQEWRDYHKRYNAWEQEEYSDEMTRAMLEPNHPNYFRANND
jgi:hypothetical protein